MERLSENRQWGRETPEASVSPRRRLLLSEELPCFRGLGAIASELKSAESPWPLFLLRTRGGGFENSTNEVGEISKPEAWKQLAGG